MIGRKLAHYEVLSRLGAGGMGEVYQARDTRLGRNVAVKVLPEMFAGDPGRIARFEREAKVLASLNHANIAALHGFEQADETHFLVMELVEGETLAERIARSPLPAGEAMDVACQIAEALEAAHEKGIVHRDLKPANVKITPDGKVKVLDFGLAKAMEKAPANSNLSNSPTLSAMATNAGVILGTAAYMSPEQARGENTDHRSDIFSFGCVLSEMLTGRQTFQGKTVADIMASVLARDPDLHALPPKLNPRIHHLLRRAIEKETKRRWQTVSDMRAEIELIQSDGVIVDEKSQASTKPLWKRALPIVVTSLFLSVIAGFVGWSLRPAVHAPVVRFPFTLPDGQQFTNTGRSVVAVSPDGAQMVYVANTRLYLRRMSDQESKPISGTEFRAVLSPVFSPDGQSLVFYADNTLKRIAVTGGATVTICEAGAPYGVSWYKDSLIYGQGRNGIMRVPANGGKPEVLVKVQEGEVLDSPQMLPDGDSLLFTLAQARTLGSDRWDKSAIVVQSTKTGARKTLIEGGSDARYLSTGHLVYAFEGTLRAVPFDLRRLELRGGPAPIMEGVLRASQGATGLAQFSVSDSGLLIYLPGPVSLAGGEQLVLGLVDRKGAVENLKLPPGPYEFPRISPDGKRLAFQLNDGKETNIWIYELSGATSMRRLTSGGSNRVPLWSGDGERIVFQSTREGDAGLFWQRADGSDVAERLTKTNAGTEHIPTSWPLHARWFAFHESGTSIPSWVFSLPDKKATPFGSSAKGSQSRSAASPDGRWLAYQSTEMGSVAMGGNEIFVQPYPATGVKYQITRTGANDPLWSPDGTELFYYVGQPSKVMAVSVKTQTSFAFTEPVLLPLPSFVQAGPNTQRNFDITPDGKRFIMVFDPDQLQAESQRNREIRIVLNWFEELQQRVPVK